ncbi:superfamily I DNA/RNA helicase [Arthrobacter sp. V4I6]|uniref:ATP-dependent helicase n=1 Tax=unclassified Arthrobacter TaxID=235627 RepID=UPI0027845337|nr:MULTISPECIES: ATP-dependent helicase [unclassified Arthrobacter]MDQ0822346.1 superfamily I DNA/RNA helicase [Arthrobacter sp. V1I7]MDQ0851971.1 superfamily I DNA/RNA helicase [Arthrobacter sp. V4I6]
MTSALEDENQAWRRCEIAWADWLLAERYAVIYLSEAVGNSSGTRAPLISFGGKRRRAPDLQTTKAGSSEYWEIKFRARTDFDPLTGERVHWTTYAAFKDYLAVADETRCKVWLILFEGPTSTSSGRWLCAEVHELLEHGRNGVRFGRGGNEVDAWVWPAAVMKIVSGPNVDLTGASVDLLPIEGDQHALQPKRLEPIERELRKRKPGKQSVPFAVPDSGTVVLEGDPAVALDVLCRSLGIPIIPRYSVLRVGLDDVEIDDLLGLLHYGIRVFLITQTEVETSLDSIEYQAFKDSRLLEWAVVGSALDDAHGTWVVDGALPSPVPNALKRALDVADEVGGINVGQYNIVHAPANADLLITAGAGTGKTETMSERVIYLLATCSGTEDTQESDTPMPFDLRADDIVLMTFTRDAARQMRERIGRALMLRQRLCRRGVFPALAWMMQLSSAEITTIHTFAKHIVQSGGGALGLSPALKVSRQTVAFRSILHDALSPYLTKLLERYPQGVPASYLWEDHFEAIWAALENNGVDLMPITGQSGEVPGVDWGGEGSDGLQGEVQRATQLVVNEIAVRFRELCLENQSIRTSDLVPFALAAIRSQKDPRVMKPRYLFVDEFQDTDALQMELILDIKVLLGARLFAVGDAKQGVYRFRGAEGNAFQELRSRVRARNLDDFGEYPLSRNFRSGASLLNSLHAHFERWGSAGLLVYTEAEKLRAQIRDTDKSKEISFQQITVTKFAERAAVDVAVWRREAPKASIAILCRRNWQAAAVRSEVQAAGLPCELLVGGSFFTSPAVRELHVLLQAVAQPSDDAALLQLCETRWAAGLLRGQPPIGVFDPSWRVNVPPVKTWHDRLGSLSTSDTYDRSDLEQLRVRIQSIGALLSRMPVMAWIVECARAFAPEASQLTSTTDDSERRRYVRCFDHLVTLLDSNFKDGPVSLQRVLSWLQLNIATNRAEDEPVEWGDLEGRTTALTVHKAKGLEFDRVIVPHSWTKFETPKNVATRVAVLRRDSELPRVVWQWNGGSGPARFSNVSEEDQSLWAQDDLETAREEARLLYVALTRAKDQLRVYVPYRRSTRNGQPKSWADLLI